MRIIVTGGRGYDNRDAVSRALRHIALPAGMAESVTLVHGDAPGADRLVVAVARILGWEVEDHPADWDTHGRAAGPIRNQQMADSGADVCLAFPGGRGTADMVRRAEAAGIPVRRVE